MTLFYQGTTVPVTNLEVGQTVTVNIEVSGLETEYRARVNDCYVRNGDNEVRIIESGEVVSTFNGLISMHPSDVYNVSMFDIVVFRLGNATTGNCCINNVGTALSVLGKVVSSLYSQLTYI